MLLRAHTAMSGTAIAVSGTAIAVSGTAIAVSGTDIAVSGTAIAVSGTAITVYGTHKAYARRRGRRKRSSDSAWTSKCRTRCATPLRAPYAMPAM
eukprot:3940713-Rhodomonas_salina.2